MTNALSAQVNLRNLVLDMLLETDKSQKSHIILKERLDSLKELDKKQRAFVTRLYQGTLERRIELDYIIDQFSKIPVRKMKPVIANIIRMSAYQLKYMDSVPESAVCNEAVKLTNKRKFAGLKGFVNGVTRNIARNIGNVEYPKTETERLSIVYSVPKWIIEMWIEQYGEYVTKNILEGLYDEKYTTIRCNESKAEIEDIVANLEYNKVEVARTPLYRNCLYISNYDKLDNLDVFNAGMVTVQDLSSMLVGLAANPNPQDYVIDVCAAPGGKSLHIAELIAVKNGEGKVEARDLTKYKTNLIKQNINRIGYKNITVKVQDALVLDEDSVGKADIVIADLPCSGLGIIGKKSDIKYNITHEQIHELVQLQRDILTVVSQYVKQGGKLIFSTCTVNKFENDDNVRWIQENLPFTLSSLRDVLPKEFGSEAGYVQIFPGDYKMDGFFISSFVRE